MKSQRDNAGKCPTCNRKAYFSTRLQDYICHACGRNVYVEKKERGQEDVKDDNHSQV